MAKHSNLHPITIASLSRTPNALAPHYARFRVSERLLLTGHSHQAWPDVSFKGQQQAWLDAATFVDEKWEKAEIQAEYVRAGYRRLLNDPYGDIALGQNTHELIARLISALPLARRSRLITTDAEFYSIQHQLDRLAEEGLEIVKFPGRPAETVAERIATAVDNHTACVLISSVYYENAEIVPNLAMIAEACTKFGAVLLIDAYHHLNVVPFDLFSMGLGNAFVTCGGYKYCQLGEGNACLRIPPHCELRPVLTGWFSKIEKHRYISNQKKPSCSDSAKRFAGATYDPTSHYRAATVFHFHERMGLTPTLLRRINQHQINLLKNSFETLDVDPAIAHVEPIPPERQGGFLAIRSPYANHLFTELLARKVFTDFRNNLLRLGPAPYLTDKQLLEASSHLGAILKGKF